MTRIEDFSQQTQDMINDNIDKPFPDAVPVLESWFGGLTRSQLIFFEQYWRDNGPETSERRIWESIKRINERPKKRITRKHIVRRQIVIRRGRRYVVWRNTRTGRFAKKRRR